MAPLLAADKQHYRDFNKVISLKAKVKLSTDHISKSVHGKRKEVSSRIQMRRERELTKETPLKWNLKACTDLTESCARDKSKA